MNAARSVHLAHTLRSGARGLSMAAMSLDRPNDQTIATRAQTCFGVSGTIAPCDRLGLGFMCRDCGCLVAAKIRVASEVCPLGKWPAVPPVGSTHGGHGQGETNRPVVPPEF